MIDWDEEPLRVAGQTIGAPDEPRNPERGVEVPLPPIEQLHAEAELLRMVEYWRLKYQDLRDSVWLTLRQK